MPHRGEGSLCGQVPSCRAADNDDKVRITSVLCNVLLDPPERALDVDQVLGKRQALVEGGPRVDGIVDRHADAVPLGQRATQCGSVDVLRPRVPPPAVDIDHHRSQPPPRSFLPFLLLLLLPLCHCRRRRGVHIQVLVLFVGRMSVPDFVQRGVWDVCFHFDPRRDQRVREGSIRTHLPRQEGREVRSFRHGVCDGCGKGEAFHAAADGGRGQKGTHKPQNAPPQPHQRTLSHQRGRQVCVCPQCVCGSAQSGRDKGGQLRPDQRDPEGQKHIRTLGDGVKHSSQDPARQCCQSPCCRNSHHLSHHPPTPRPRLPETIHTREVCPISAYY